MAVDQGHPFPVLPSKTIAFAVNVMRDDKPHLAIIPSQECPAFFAGAD